MNRTRFPKEDHLPDWARRNNKDTKGDREYYIAYWNAYHEIPSLAQTTEKFNCTSHLHDHLTDFGAISLFVIDGL